MGEAAARHLVPPILAAASDVPQVVADCRDSVVPLAGVALKPGEHARLRSDPPMVIRVDEPFGLASLLASLVHLR
jgi:hypothetical protein